MEKQGKLWYIKVKWVPDVSPEIDTLPFTNAQYRKAYYAQEDHVLLLFVKFYHPQLQSRFSAIDGILSATLTTESNVQDFDNFTDEFIGEIGQLKETGPTVRITRKKTKRVKNTKEDTILQDIKRTLKKHKLLKRKLQGYDAMKKEFDAIDETVNKLQHRWKGE